MAVHITRRSSFTLLVLFLAALLVRVAFVYAVPPFEKPDEAAHYKFVGWIVDHGALPRLSIQSVDDWSLDEYEFHQAPLYYVLASPVVAAGRSAGWRESTIVDLLRLVTGLVSLILIPLTWRMAERLVPGGSDVALVAASVPALLPTFAFLSTSVSNDTLAFVLSAWVLLIMVDVLCGAPLDLRRGGLLVVALALALLSKTSSLLLLGSGALFCVLLMPTRPREARAALAALAIGAAAAAPWYLRNLHLYGDLTGLGLVNSKVVAGSFSVERIGDCLVFMQQSFWANFGKLYEINAPWSAVTVVTGKANAIFLMLTLLAALSLVEAAWRGNFPRRLVEAMRASGDDNDAGRVRAWILCGLTIAAYLGADLAYGVRYEQAAHARHYFPVLAPLSIGMAAALQRWRMGWCLPVVLGIADPYLLARLILPIYGGRS